jgi:hypothetical protein
LPPCQGSLPLAVAQAICMAEGPLKKTLSGYSNLATLSTRESPIYLLNRS